MGVSVALAAAGLGLAVWLRRRNGSSGGGSISGAAGQSAGYGATGQTSGSTSQWANSWLPAGTYAALEELNPVLVHEPPVELSGDPADADDSGDGARGLDFGRPERDKEQRDRGPPEATKLLL